MSGLGTSTRVRLGSVTGSVERKEASSTGIRSLELQAAIDHGRKETWHVTEGKPRPDGWILVTSFESLRWVLAWTFSYMAHKFPLHSSPLKQVSMVCHHREIPDIHGHTNMTWKHISGVSGHVCPIGLNLGNKTGIFEYSLSLSCSIQETLRLVNHQPWLLSQCLNDNVKQSPPVPATFVQHFFELIDHCKMFVGWTQNRICGPLLIPHIWSITDGPLLVHLSISSPRAPSSLLLGRSHLLTHMTWGRGSWCLFGFTLGLLEAGCHVDQAGLELTL